MGRRRHPNAKAVLERIDAAVASDRQREETLVKRVESSDGPLSSLAESTFRELMVARGATVLRAGWPDFLVVTASGKALCVEVKSTADRMRPSQVRCFEALEKAGVEIRVWWEKRPESLMAWRDFLRITRDMRQRAGSSGVGVRIRAALNAFANPPQEEE